MGRRKALEPDIEVESEFDEEAAKKIYTNDKYQPPDLTDLETIFEVDVVASGSDEGVARVDDSRGRRKCFVDASGKMSKAPRRLRLENKNWLENKEKEKKRGQMIAKLFKGRKKVKRTGLNAKQEEKLFKIIDEIEHSEENENVPQKSPTKNVAKKKKDKCSPKKSLLSKKPESKNSAEQNPSNSAESSSTKFEAVTDQVVQCETMTESESSARQTVGTSSDSLSTFGDLANFRLSDELAWAPLPRTPIISTEEGTVDMNTQATKKSVKRRSTRRKSSMFRPKKNVHLQQVQNNLICADENEAPISSSNLLPGGIESNVDQELELARQIFEADSYFGPIDFGNKQTDHQTEEKEDSGWTDTRSRASLDHDDEQKTPTVLESQIKLSAKCKGVGRRSSMVSTKKMNVRRSSRFLHSTAENSQEDLKIIGSVYQEMDVHFKKKHAKEMEQKTELSPEMNDKSKSRRRSSSSRVLLSLENVS